MPTPIPYSDIARFLHQIERKYPVSEWTLWGTHIWPFLRIEIAVNLRKLNYVGAFIQKGSKKIGRADIFKIIIKDREHRGRICRRNDVALFGISSGKTRVGGSYYNQYMDPLLSFLKSNGMSVIHIERNKSGIPQVPRFNPSLLIDYTLLRFVFRLLGKFPNKKNANSKLDGLGRLREELSPFLDNISFLDEHSLMRRFKKIIGYKKFYSILLKLLHPRFAVVQCFYSSDSMAICWACRSLSIPCFDYQHGVQGQTHYAYSAWNNIPDSGYELMPTGYLTWDTSSAGSLRSWVCDNIPVYTIGNLWHEGCSNLLSMFKKTYEELSSKAAGKKVVLYTTQDFLPPSWLLSSISLMPDLFWCIRLHPQYKTLKDFLKTSLGDASNYDIDISTELPLPLMMMMSDVHVTGSSSVVVEARLNGLPSIVTDSIGKTYYKEYIEEGTVCFAGTKADFRKRVAGLGDNMSRKMGKAEYPDRVRFISYIRGSIRSLL